MYRDAMTPYRPGHEPPAHTTAQRSQMVALLLAAFMGFWGVHRFYTGRFLTGLLQFMTGGGFLIWWFIDVLRIAAGTFTDAEGRRLAPGFAPQAQALDAPHQHARLPMEPHDPWQYTGHERAHDHASPDPWNEEGYDGSCDDAHGAPAGYARSGGYDGGKVPGPVPRHGRQKAEPILDPLEEKFRELEAQMRNAPAAPTPAGTGERLAAGEGPRAASRRAVGEMENVGEVGDTDGALESTTGGTGENRGSSAVRLEKSREAEAAEPDALEESFRELERELARPSAKASVPS